MSIPSSAYHLHAYTLQVDEVGDDQEWVTDMLPLKACLAGWHQELGFIRSPAYWTPRFFKDTWERWEKHGVEDITLEYAESNTPVFG